MRRTARIATIAGLGAGLIAGAGACGTTPAADPAAAQPVAVQAVGKPDQATVAKLFTEWNATLATGDPQQVADRYAADAVLLPTLSDQVRTDRAGIVDYFTHFLEAKPRGEIKQSTVSVLDENTAVDAGVYVFTLTEDGEEKQVEARYTYVYELRDDAWVIVNHHSSAMPEQAAKD